MTINRDTIIADLGSTTTFYDWWTKENEEIIEKLNLMKVFSATGGSGIEAATDINGLLTISIGGNAGISSGITFNGPVEFNGRTILPNISYKITGITSGTSGYTFGTPIYLNETSGGYTAASATSQDSSEVIGLLSYLGNSYSIVTVAGKIDGNFTGVAGGNLSAGCIYFLSTTNGQITTVEPSTDGYVSKPLMMGIGATSGIIIPHRGQLLDSSSGSGGNTGANDIYVTLNGAQTDFTIGAIVSYFTPNSQLDSYFDADARTHYSGWFLSKSVGNQTSPFADGNEEDFVVGTITNRQQLTGSTYLYRITTFGTVATNLGGPGVYYLSNSWTSISDQLVKDPGSFYNGKLYAIQYDASNYTILNKNLKNIVQGSGSFRSGVLGSSSATSGSTAGSSVKNIFLNGDFSIWQRKEGKNSGYTGQDDLVFADMWRRVDGMTGVTKDFRIERKEFSDYQINIEGNPEYYLEIKAMAATLGATSEYLTVGHVIPSAKALNDQTVVLSFYAKGSHNGYPVDLYYARYNNGIQADKTLIDTFTVSTSWQRFDFNFDITDLTDLLVDRVNDYTEIGFDFIPTIETALDNSLTVNDNVYLNVASMCLFMGDTLTLPHYHEPLSQRLSECRRYYYSTYASNEYPGQVTVNSDGSVRMGIPTHNVIPLSFCNHIAWPTEMRITPTVIIYSPKTGAVDAFNETSGRDCRLSSGTFGYDNKPRVVKIGQQTVFTTVDNIGMRICVGPGTVNYDRVFYHIIANADYPLPS